MTKHYRKYARFLVLTSLLVPAIAACNMGNLGPTVKRGAFTSAKYGVTSSPRVTTNPHPPRGGGRYQVGKPYTVAGRTYVPQHDPAYVAAGTGSWYGADFHGRKTANGEIFSANAITAAHPTLPLPSYVRVTNKDNGRSLVVRVNDRGPYVAGRVIDLSYRSAAMLGYVENGSANVEIAYVGEAPLNGDDTRQLMASYNGPQEFGKHTQVATGNFGVTNNIFGMFGGLFAYAEAGAVPDSSAQAATNAMAAGGLDLAAFATPGAVPVNVELGVFYDDASAQSVSERFAVLGAVTESALPLSSGSALKLTLTNLKPGVTEEDVRNLAAEVGIVL